MRILVLAKRQYTGKDLLDDRFGRLFEIPAALARRGHAIQGLSLSYRRRPEGDHAWADAPGMAWRSMNALPTGLVAFPSELAKLADRFSPDVVWASSDVLHIAAAARYCRLSGVPLVVDLYDNYESFGLTRLPGAVQLLRHGCRQAAAISTVSRSLQAHVVATYRTMARVGVVGNGVRTDIFRPRDRAQARRRFGLPADGFLVGTAGALTRDRGIQGLLRAFEALAARHANVFLVLAGPRDGELRGRLHERVIDLGMIPHADVGELLSALDLGVVCNLDSDFGRYCFPLKLHEMLACGIPVLAAATGDVAGLLSAWPGSHYRPGDAGDLLQKMEAHLATPGQGVSLAVPDWEDAADQLLALLAPLPAREDRG